MQRPELHSFAQGMVICQKVNPPRVVEMTVTIASVPGHRPLIGFGEEVEKSWLRLKKKYSIKSRKEEKSARAMSVDELYKMKKQIEEIQAALPTNNNNSDVGKVMLKFRQLEENEKEGKKEDVYSKDYVPKKYSKYSEEYGRPKPGTLTEKRALKATATSSVSGKHIAREMLQLCEVIIENGYQSAEGTMKITFGKLFQIYQYISDKVVGILLRARKQKMLAFEGEMLYQRRDEDVIITCLLSQGDISEAYKQI